MAAVEAGKEIAWMRNILSEFGYGIQEPSTLKMDNIRKKGLISQDYQRLSETLTDSRDLKIQRHQKVFQSFGSNWENLSKIFLILL